MSNVTLVKVGPGNLLECGIGCIRNRDNPGYGRKVKWLRKRFAEGLRFLLFRDEREDPLAFLEYVPGEFAWRPVDAQGWLFVHCLWVFPAGQQLGGWEAGWSGPVSRKRNEPAAPASPPWSATARGWQGRKSS